MSLWSLRPDVPSLRGARATVMGLGLFGGGAGAVRFLASRGARVTVTDLRTADQLRESISALDGLPVEFHLGGHREEDFTRADLVLVNPAVPSDSPWLGLARSLDTEMNLFFKLCRARPVVGVTGSNGKTTTTALIGEILKKGPRPVWVGGNIGAPLLERVDEIGPEDLVVLELSSFQLEHLDAIGRSPNVAVVMNLTPNHLDRHGTMGNYAAAKRVIVAHQAATDWKVLNADDPLVAGFTSPSRTAWFSRIGPATSWRATRASSGRSSGTRGPSTFPRAGSREGSTSRTWRRRPRRAGWPPRSGPDGRSPRGRRSRDSPASSTGSSSWARSGA
ncbi:MAG TPA: Mur ligase family protein [Planctomycetota bacterium]|nr:Mur ligase family protein [Planctomycetota bacterium]